MATETYPNAGLLKQRVLDTLGEIDRKVGMGIPRKYRSGEKNAFHVHNGSMIDRNGNVIVAYRDLADVDIEELVDAIPEPVILISESQSTGFDLQRSWITNIGDPREVLWNAGLGFTVIVPRRMSEVPGVYTYDPQLDRRSENHASTGKKIGGDIVVRMYNKSQMRAFLEGASN